MLSPGMGDDCPPYADSTRLGGFYRYGCRVAGEQVQFAHAPSPEGIPPVRPLEQAPEVLDGEGEAASPCFEKRFPAGPHPVEQLRTTRLGKGCKKSVLLWRKQLTGHCVHFRKRTDRLDIDADRPVPGNRDQNGLAGVGQIEIKPASADRPRQLRFSPGIGDESETLRRYTAEGAHCAPQEEPPAEEPDAVRFPGEAFRAMVFRNPELYRPESDICRFSGKKAG